MNQSLTLAFFYWTYSKYDTVSVFILGIHMKISIIFLTKNCKNKNYLARYDILLSKKKYPYYTPVLFLIYFYL